MARLWTGLTAALVLTGAASEALAQDIDDGLHSVTEILPGTPLQSEISDAYIRVKDVGGGTPAKVKNFDGNSGGRVHLRANYIHIEEGGILTVTGAGWAGVPNAAGQGPGAGGFLTPGPAAGGGAGAVGPGGAGGPIPACDGTGGPGGPAHLTAPAALTMAPLLPGSTRGAVPRSAFDSAGGEGGGVIILEASLVRIDGTVEAKGGPSLSAARPGGGGAGGMIFIKAYTLELGDSAMISVAGGDGSANATVAAGGGAGGVIILQTREPPTDDPRLIVAGGVSGVCPGTGDGAPGTVAAQLPGPTECFDLDDDGFAACKPGGDEVDCNDVDPAVNGDASEQCDDLNLDDNCNQVPDHAEEDQEAICGNGGACKAPEVDDAGVITEFASCVPAEEIEEEKPPETETVFFGGCGVGAGRPFAALATLGLAAALLARWRRRKSA
ncbi:MAG: hypothetical protein WKG00_37510 [Polyangiaceae bacterium]